MIEYHSRMVYIEFMRIPLTLIALVLATVSGFSAENEESDINSPKLQNPGVFKFPQSVSLKENIYDGRALAIIEIGPQGEVRDAVCVQASHPAFAKATMEGLGKATFEPATENGNAIPVRQPLELKFSSSGGVHSISTLDDVQTLLRQGTNTGKGFTLTPLKNLDEPIKLKSQGKVYKPVDENEKPIEGKAVVSFYIGRKGGVHMPEIVSSSDPRLDEAVFKSLKDFEFTIPKLNGEPVPVKVDKYEFVVN